MPRPEGITTSASETRIFSRTTGLKTCPDQRGLRLLFLGGEPVYHRLKTCPDQRGLRLQLSQCSPLGFPWFEDMPRPEGITTGSLIRPLTLLAWFEDMPRPEGITTYFFKQSPIMIIWFEDMPRPEGITTVFTGTACKRKHGFEDMPRPEGITTFFQGRYYSVLFFV